MKVEAEELSIICNDSRRADDNDYKWVQELEPIVFYRFDREREEKYERGRHHHWQVIHIRMQYPPNMNSVSFAENTIRLAVAH
jgi:hypothetical protein